MIINHNMASLNTYRQLSINNANTSKALEKLSSGLRINRAGDDAAGLAISEKMRGQIRGLDQAARNAQDAISLIQTAEGGLNEVHSILQRMRELAVQASNDTATDSDRNEIQKEVVQLKSELDRIGNTTEFNTKKLLNGEVGTSMISSNATTLKAISTTSDTQSGVYAVNFTTAATKATITGGDITTASGILKDQTININGTSITLQSGETLGQVAAKINAVAESTGVKAIVIQGTAATQQKLILETTEYGSKATINITSQTAGVDLSNIGLNAVMVQSAAGTDAAGTINGVAAVGDGNTLTLTATDNAKGLSVEAVVNAQAATTSFDIGIGGVQKDGTLTINGYGITMTAATMTTTASVVDAINAASGKTGVIATYNGTTITFSSVATGDNAKVNVIASAANVFTNDLSSGISATGTDNIDTTVNDGTITVNKDGVLKMHIGANKDQNMDIDISDMRVAALGLSNIDLTTQSGANSAILTINDAIETVSAERAKLGAYQNRLEHTIANLGTSSENLTAAESRIRDVDMAKEMMNFQKNSILAQAAQAMLEVLAA